MTLSEQKAQRETINKQNTEIIQLQRNANGNNILEVEERLKGIITSKIDELQQQFHHCQKQTKQSFADVVNQPAPSSLKNIIKETKTLHEFHRKVSQGQFLKCCFKPEFFIYFACWKSKKSIFNQFLERKFDWKYFFMKHFDLSLIHI